MVEYCQRCKLMLITDRERTLDLCRFCMTDYERKYVELIKFNDWYWRRLLNYFGAGAVATLACVYRILSQM
jgi:hypothetical protein